MSSDFEAIGWPEPSDDLDYFNRFFADHGEAGFSLPAADGSYLLWQIGGGPELWVTLDGSGDALDVRPHFAGQVRRKVAIIERLPSPEDRWSGAFHCHANPGEDDPEDYDYPLVVEVAGFRLYDHLELPMHTELGVTAFALTLEFHSSAKAFEDAQPVLGYMPAGIPDLPSGPIKMGPEYFVPTGTMEAEGEPNSLVEFAGEIISARYQQNPVTGRRYWWIHARTHGGEIDIVADPAIVPTDPAPNRGNIVKGHFWLSGRPYPPGPARGG